MRYFWILKGRDRLYCRSGKYLIRRDPQGLARSQKRSIDN